MIVAAARRAGSRDNPARPWHEAAMLAAFAPAKVNLTLDVLGRRADGYHEIESLVVFAAVGDRLTLDPGAPLALDVGGETAASAGADADNLVLKAARAFAAAVPDAVLGRFALTKMLPVAAGLGGGSADAAAALRLLAEANGLAPGDPRLHAAAVATGADVPVCLDPRPRLMTGIGEILSAPLDLPPLPALLVNPGVPVATREVFAALACRHPPPDHRNTAAGGDATRDLPAFLAAHRNDLEAPARRIQPVIGEVLARLRACAGCFFARMSGSGATCFGLFDGAPAAETAAALLARERPGWWVRATVLGAGPAVSSSG